MSPELKSSRIHLMLGSVCLLVCIIPARFTHASEPVTLTCGRFELQFSANGHPASFKTKGDGQELLATNDPRPGFYLLSRDNIPLRFDQLKVENGKLVAFCGGLVPRVTFGIHSTDSYLALHVERMEGVPATREYSMHFQMKLLRPVRAFELDYMTEARGGTDVAVDWRHVWNRNPENPKGGFALYLPKDNADEDETILRIWVNEGLPHPKVDGEWDLAAAHKWVDRWLKELGDQSRFWIAARTDDELYSVVPYAQKAGVRDVYLFTDTWRGGVAEPFWANKQTNCGINKAVFPRGEEDLRAFSDYLRERNMNLKLHYVSGGIGLRDPQYIGESPDQRLAGWGRGRLEQKAGDKDTTLYFRPEPGTAMPFRLPAPDWWQRYTCPPALHNVFDFDFVVVGDELIKVGSFEDTDMEVWRLEECRRGQSTTKAARHRKCTPVRGLITSYGGQFLPDNDSSLLAEMAQNYAGMLNRCGIAHTEYDGAEIHTYNGRMWGFNKFASLVYSHLDHPVTAFTSSGWAPPCAIEYKLNRTQHALRDRQKGIVAILLDQPFRPASNVLDAHWGLSQMCAHDYTIYNIMKPEPLFGIDIKTLQAHGQTDQLLETAHNWKRVNQLIAPEQREQMRKTMFHEDDLLGQAGHHEQSALVHVLSKGAGQWEIHPTKVLTGAGNEDVRWQDGQEHGAISPRQFVKPGETLALVNPFREQQPRLIMRVLWGFDTASKGDLAAKGSGTDNRGADSAFDYAKMTSSARDKIGSRGNVLLQPSPDEMRNQRDTRFSVDGEALVVEANNPRDQPALNEDDLPEWSRSLDMTQRRGIGLWVTGDGSGAILTFQIPGGDYVVPLTFTGRRYIEIPNAQVAWSNGYWGWRMGSKRSYYEQVNWLKLGFGLLPPHTNARASVEGLTALQEIATELHNPVLHAGKATLRFSGTVASGQYLTWEGGPTAAVYDANWNHVSDLPVSGEGFVVPTGDLECRITADPGTTPPWVELQLMTRDNPMIIPDPVR